MEPLGGILIVAVAATAAGLLAGRRRPAAAESRSRTVLGAIQRFHALRHLPELAAGIAREAVDVLGVGRAVLYLWSDEAGAFVPRDSCGHGSGPCPDHLDRETWQAMIRTADRVGPGYLCHDPASAAAAPPHLVVPLVTSSGESLGLLALGDPGSRGWPAGARGEDLVVLAGQAATALESAIVYDTLARRNEELATAAAKLEGLDELKRNLVANVGHELRTPLTSIRAYTELLQRNIADLDPGSLEDFLDVIANESAKLSDVIGDILEVGRMQEEPTLPMDETTDLSGLVAGLAHGWRERAASAGIELVVAAPRRPLLLPVDRVLMGQLLTHLVGNAFKFTPAGGRVRCELAETGTAVRLRVEDDGIGIPPDQLGRIFEDFHQADGSATRSYNGQGLGLAICRDIVHHHDGRIWAENRPDGGARFTVLLPRRSPVVLAPEAAGPSSLPFAGGEFDTRLLHWVSGCLGVRTATLMVPDDERRHLVIRAAIGLPAAVVQSSRVSRDEGFAGRAWAAGKSLLVADVTESEVTRREESEPRYTTPSVLCVPLRSADRTLGVISVNNRADGRPLDEDDRLLLDSLAPRLVRLLESYGEWTDRTRWLGDLRGTLRTTTPVGHPGQETLRGLCRETCLATARRIGLTEGELGRLAFALEFYDVGLEEVPQGILRQPGGLSEVQRRLVRGHVHASLRILAPLDPDPGVNRLILHHHENFDGSGYPEGLAGESIPLGSRLIRLADVLESMLEDRPDRPAMSLDEAVAEIRSEAGRMFCPRLTQEFLHEVAARAGRITTLQDNRASVACLIRQTHSGRPLAT